MAQIAQFSDVSITSEQFETICGDLFNSTIGLIKQVLRDATVDKASVKEVVLAGGLSRMPKLHKIISDFFGIPTSRLMFPDMACVRGATLYVVS